MTVVEGAAYMFFVAFVGYGAYSVSPACDDQYVRRILLPIWFLIGLVTALVFSAAYSSLDNAAIAGMASTALAGAGGWLGYRAAERLRERRVKLMQRRAHERVTTAWADHLKSPGG